MSDMVDAPFATGPDGPQDTQVSRRWVLNRFAWLTTAAAGGAMLVRPDIASAAKTPRSLPEEALLAPVRDDVGDLTELTIAEALSLLHSRKVAPDALVNALVDRIEAFDTTYQAFAARPSRETIVA